MAKTRRNSIENMFAKKGSVQPQKKTVVQEEQPVIEAVEETVEPVVEEAPVEKAEVKESKKVETVKAETPKEVIDEPKKEVKKEVKEKRETKVSRPASIDNLFGSKKKERGKQQTIYFKKEVYDFCNDIAEQYEIGMSDVVNKLIQSIMEEE